MAATIIITVIITTTIMITEITTITAITTTTIDETAVSGTSLLRLLSWLSPAFPLGGFAYSGGLERAVHDRLLEDAEGLKAWLSSGLAQGFLRNDALLLCESHKAGGDVARIGETAALATALAGARERHAETLALGAAFVTAARAWPAPVLDELPETIALPVAFGAVASAHGIGLTAACQGYLHAQIAQSVSAAIRLSLCGQVAGLEVLSGLEKTILETASRAAQSGLDDLGGCTFRADISTLRHETQHSRLFRS
ncbi:urease accessory protein UreF [Martelella mangrovi]|uniref:Urease accessory protein UreF n=1 Tax=Martelella mangrovi TaxID=1397477 RepID=A0ABV2I700_9HYPH